MTFTVNHPSTNLSATTNVGVINNTSPFNVVTAEGSGNSVTVSFSGTHPNQAVGGNINYTFGIEANTTYQTAVDCYFISQGTANYTVSPTYANSGLIAAHSAAGATATMTNIIINATAGYKFTQAPSIVVGSGSSANNIYLSGAAATTDVTHSGTTRKALVLSSALSNNDTRITISGTAAGPDNLPDGVRAYANMYLPTVTGSGTLRITGIQIGSLVITTSQVWTYENIDGDSGDTTDIDVTIQKEATTTTTVAVAKTSWPLNNNVAITKVNGSSISATGSTTLTGSGNETITLTFTGTGNTTSLTFVDFTVSHSGATTLSLGAIGFYNQSL